ncbi:MAG: HAD family hydrolase [Candidatus Heimdallarchaeaceae archaeon]
MEKIPIFFDFGGTIVDNIKVAQISYNSIFKKNLSIDEIKLMYQIMSSRTNLKDLLSLPINPLNILLKQKKLKNLQNKLIFQHAELFPSSREVLFKLKDKNEVELVIVTQNPQLKNKEFVDKLLNKLFKTDHPFDQILSDYKKIRIIKQNFSESQISKSLFIGDLQNDMDIAKKLGIPGIGAAWGYSDGKLNANFVVNDFESLYTLIDSHVSNVIKKRKQGNKE